MTLPLTVRVGNRWKLKMPLDEGVDRRTVAARSNGYLA